MGAYSDFLCLLALRSALPDAEVLSMVGRYLGLDLYDTYFTLRSGEQFAQLSGSTLSRTWTIAGWLCRRRDLSAGDLLVLTDTPAHVYSLRAEDLPLFGESMSEDSSGLSSSASDMSWELVDADEGSESPRCSGL